MKNLLKIVVFIFITLSMASSANAINVGITSHETTSCPWDNNDVTYYISWNSYERFLGDMFWTSDDRYISTNSDVTIWYSDPNLLSGCNSSSDWSRISSLSPGSNTEVLALWANCTFNKPTDKNNRTLQFVYNIKYYDIISGWGASIWDWDLAYFLNTTEANDNTPHFWSYTNVGFDNELTHDNECFNVELRYCWDEIREATEWEQCDDWNNINWDWCSATCQTEPVCNSLTVTPASWLPGFNTVLSCNWNTSTYRIEVANNNWTIIDSINSNFWNLSFSDVWTYTATCYVAWITSPACTKTITVTPPACTAWTITWVQTSAIDGSIPWLCPINTTAANFVEVVNWTLSNYTWTCDWLIWWNCSASYDTNPGNCTAWTITWVQNDALDGTETWYCSSGTFWDFLATVNWITTNYTWSCDWETWWTCNASYSNNNGGNCIAWTTSWEQNSPINSTNVGLCPVWQTSADFLSTLNGTITSYSWSCDWEVWWTCWAYYDSSINHVCEAWTITWLQTSRVYQTSTGLCPVWQTAWNFVTSVSWNRSSYTWGCNWLSWWNCSASYVSGWWTSACISWGVSWTVSSRIDVTTPNLCPTWEIARWFQATLVGNTINYLWTCNWRNWGSCHADYTSGWGWGGWTFCWDGWLQRPNDDSILEECDFWSGTWPLWCTSSCQITNTTMPNSGLWEITIPWGWSFDFWPIDNILIWVWMNPFITHDLIPFVTNNSSYDFYLSKLCVKWIWTSVSWAEDCRSISFLPATWTYTFNSYPIIKWINNFIDWTSYSDNEIKTYLEDSNWDSSYNEAILDVRVSRPSISTVWGWTTYLQDTSDIANINNVADNDTENKNFVWVWVDTGDNSSYSDDIDDSDLIDEVVEEWEDYSSGVLDDVIVTVSNLWPGTMSNFESYNWIANVNILKDYDFDITWGQWTSFPSGSRTYIIENWDLTISENIEFSDNIAFIVKWWNIIIKNNVTRIDWTYITIWDSIVTWLFKWESSTTTNILLVNGSLYWNINDLISKRTYVKQQSSGLIDVWTIVSFGSSLFRKPAPLITTFINEYLTADKIAK